MPDPSQPDHLDSQERNAGLSTGQGHLLQNLVLFGRLLRGLGLDINPGRMIDLVSALGLIDIRLKQDFYHATRSLLVHRVEDLALFDMAFDLFWQDHDDAWKAVNFRGPSWQKK
ncbi:MAG: hypothetical protein R3335_12300, partial [Anaerolineales bacterium]|nr:hypothetical protein [Anaerolineales bacterium]